MILEIRHRIDYSYSREVFLEPLVLHLRPWDDFSQRVRSFEMEISPTPGGKSESLDLFNNPQVNLWFSLPQSHWGLETKFKVETLLENPFNYVVTDDQTLRLPARYSAERQPVLAPYLFRVAPDKAVENLAQDLSKESDGNTLNFLSGAADFLSREIHQVIRAEGEPLSPAKTLQRKEGACRDAAILFMDLCRSVGLAARFASGYKYDPEAKDGHELHAWTEVYLPGAGWRGYDPALGLAVADRHVLLAVGPTAPDAAAVSGTFRGTGVLSRMRYEVEIHCLEPVKPGP